MQTIMFIRHAEKPEKAEKGVTPDGEHDEHSLSVRGWTRAGALAALFANTSGRQHLVEPARVIATAPSHSYKSKREHDTALPTAERLNLKIDAIEVPEKYTQLVEELQTSSSPALIVWHHGTIPDFIRSFPLTNASEVPEAWPEDRFDLIWVLSPSGDGYEWHQAEQQLLQGDAFN
jgi:broad specificity phosphatase PhoE